ncbi:hypothetical protein [Streptomyces sp. A012304]|uniref:hypothetical protein n=1 Tax=Streptomyces sp. A012304 TaxID=375446 RepID=UPI00222E64DE|nr:hypothetical protein [Streptomyces sp. A012304]
MLRIIDARTGEPTAAAPVRRGLTRVQAHASADDAGELRVLLVADLLVRALELGGTPVLATLAGDRHRPRLRAAATALGVRPFEDGQDLGGQVVHVLEAGRGAPEGIRVEVAAVRDPRAFDRVLAEDPAALRLTLLSHHHRDPVRLDTDMPREAHDTLARWRRAVARWARHPSRPVPDEVRDRLRTAWEADLDVPEVLRVLRWVERAGPDLADGARFETYAYADRLLGLDLTRDLGAPA